MTSERNWSFETMLHQAIHEEEISSFEEITSLPELPESLRLNRVIKRLARKEKRRAGPHYIQKVAVVFCLAVGVGIFLTANVEAVRSGLWEFFIEVRQAYSSIWIGEDAQSGHSDAIDYPEDWSNYWRPNYLPDGYYLKEATIIDDAKRLQFFRTDDDYIFLTQWDNLKKIQSDTEDAKTQIVYVGKNEGLLTEKPIKQGILRTLIWKSEEKFFKIVTLEDAKTLIKIAQELEYVQ